MPRPGAAPARSDSIVTPVFLVAYVALLMVGAPFVVGHHSTYLAPIVVPFLAIVILLVTFALIPGRWWGRLRLRVPGWIGTPFGIGVTAWSLHFAHHRPDAHVSVLFFILLPCLIVFVWARVTRRPHPLLVGLPFLLLGIIAFTVELPGRRPALPEARWGDASTFATTWPVAPPYIGPGGRLRPDLDVLVGSGEAPEGVRLTTNSTGFRNTGEVPELPAQDEFRVLNLGDSFSIGMQADQADFFGAALENRLRSTAPDRPVTVVNAEISDPAFGLFYLQEFGLRYRPNVVLLGLCGNDMLQAENFVGADGLFHLDGSGTLVPNPAPQRRDAVARYRDVAYPVVCDRAVQRSKTPNGLKRVYRFGHKLAQSARKLHLKLAQFRVFRALRVLAAGTPRPALMHSYAADYEREDGRMRLLDGTANLGYFYQWPEPAVETLYERLFELLIAADRTAREAGAKLVVVLHPQRFQVVEQDWKVIRDAWCLDESDFDLEIYNGRVGAFCRENGIECCDLLGAFRAASRDRGLYLPLGDMHYNRAGHEVAAEDVARVLRPLLEHE